MPSRALQRAPGHRQRSRYWACWTPSSSAWRDILDTQGQAVEVASAAIFSRPTGKRFELAAHRPCPRPVGNLDGPHQPGQPRAAARRSPSLAREIGGDRECKAHLKSLQSDAQSLTEHASFESSHIAFLLDAALGLINIEQNGIIKIFSVMAVIFMPPTLVASIYGMNFHHMPELSWPIGYPMALGPDDPLGRRAGDVVPQAWVVLKIALLG